MAKICSNFSANTLHLTKLPFKPSFGVSFSVCPQVLLDAVPGALARQLQLSRLLKKYECQDGNNQAGMHSKLKNQEK